MAKQTGRRADLYTRSLDLEKQLVPLTIVDDSRLVPLAVDNSRIVPMTPTPSKDVPRWGGKIHKLTRWF